MFRRSSVHHGSTAASAGSRFLGGRASSTLGWGSSALMVGAGAQYYWSGQQQQANSQHSMGSSSSPSTSVVFCDAPAAKAPYTPDPKNVGKRVNGLPEFSYEEIAKHNVLPPPEKGGKKAPPKKGGPTPSVWIHYKAGVYDITDFIYKHPGGEKRIALAAGGGIEKYWNIYTQHNDEAVHAILEPHRIGNVKDYKEAPAKNTEEMWSNEPKRGNGVHMKNARPFNAETPEMMMEQFITPNDNFFVRNHMPVPDIKVEGDKTKGEKPFCLQVDGEGYASKCFSIDELKENFPQRTVTTTIQCGGNRRSEMTAQVERESGGSSGLGVKGLSWTNGGIGTANWTGVLLSDVMDACAMGIRPTGDSATDPNMDSYHVHLFGADADVVGPFSVSAPYPKVADKSNEVLVAWKMNGEDIPRDHGYPLRAILPGHVGVRNCKWLNRVSVQPIEAQSVWQQSDYKFFPSWATKPDPALPSVYAMPVQSSVTSAVYDTSNDEVNVKGYAYCGGGTGIQRVEVSLDGGKSFQTAATLKTDQPERLPHAQKDSLRSKEKQWAWSMFEATIDSESVPESFKVKPSEAADPDDKTFVVCSKAITVDNASQPQKGTYNFRGLLFNGFSCREADVL